MSVAPEGREGVFTAMASAPLFLGKFVTGTAQILSPLIPVPSHALFVGVLCTLWLLHEQSRHLLLGSHGIRPLLFQWLAVDRSLLVPTCIMQSALHDVVIGCGYV